jgi:hypothetical protein
MELVAPCGNQLEPFEFRLVTDHTFSIGDVDYNHRWVHITETVVFRHPSSDLRPLTSVYPACPVAPADGTGVKFLPSSTNLLLLFNRGFAEKECNEFNRGPLTFYPPIFVAD